MAAYSDWNEAIGNWFFHAHAADETVRLTVDAVTLRHCMKEHEGLDAFNSDEQAKLDFIEAVQVELAERDFHWIWLSKPDSRNRPDFLGLLAVQVLAVYEMVDDPKGRYTRNNYWTRLAEMLGLELSGNLPHGFKYTDHQDLWRKGLEYWANDLRQGRLGRIVLPPAFGGFHHVSIPFSHAILRTADLEQLDRFFEWAGLRPGMSVVREQMLRRLRYHRGEGRLFSPHARRVLEDDPDRLEPACDQVLRYFNHWDGRSESLRRVITRPRPREIELSLCVTRQEPIALEIRLEDTAAKRTQPLGDENVAELLRGGQINRLNVGGLLFRPRQREFVLAVHDATANKYFGQAKACPGDHVLLLLHWHRKKPWLASLEKIAPPDRIRRFLPRDEFVESTWTSLRRLPTDWCLIQLQLRQEITDPPAPWDTVIDREAIRLRPVGGLRLSQSEWLGGAGPVIRVDGRDVPSHLYVDDNPFPVEDRMMISRHLDQPGVHIVSVNRSDGPRGPRMRIVVRESQMVMQSNAFGGGWVRTDAGWPELEDRIEPQHRERLSYVVGAAVHGLWPLLETRVTCPERETLLLLVLQKSGLRVKDQHLVSGHPVVEALRLANATRLTAHDGVESMSHGFGDAKTPTY